MKTRPAIIFFYEENRMLLQTVKDVLEFAGWYVKPCESSGYAVAYIESDEHFDLLILDHDSSISGLKLVQRARQKAQRKRTPVILILLEDIADEAREADADAFLRKPNNLITLVDTIRSLLAARRASP
jgi:DNA-binding response OmpR family regulator